MPARPLSPPGAAQTCPKGSKPLGCSFSIRFRGSVLHRRHPISTTRCINIMAMQSTQICASNRRRIRAQPQKQFHQREMERVGQRERRETRATKRIKEKQGQSPRTPSKSFLRGKSSRHHHLSIQVHREQSIGLPECAENHHTIFGLPCPASCSVWGSTTECWLWYMKVHLNEPSEAKCRL